MKTITYFEAYQQATELKELALRLRSRGIGKGIMGIAVAQDCLARQWQRRERQTRKFEAKIRNRLMREKTGGEGYGTNLEEN